MSIHTRVFTLSGVVAAVGLVAALAVSQGSHRGLAVSRPEVRLQALRSRQGRRHPPAGPLCRPLQVGRRLLTLRGILHST